MPRFPKSRFNRLRIVSMGNSLLILVGNDLNLCNSIPTEINKEFPIGDIRSRLKLYFGKRDIFKHRDRETNCKTEYRGQFYKSFILVIYKCSYCFQQGRQ